MENINFEKIKLKFENEKISNVFDLDIDVYESIKKPNKLYSINLYELFHMIQNNFLTGISFEDYSTPKYHPNGDKNSSYDKVKSELPVVCYPAQYNGYKNLSNIKNINNLMFLEIDGFKSKEHANSYKKEITDKYNWIVACYLSLSRVGLHIVAKVDNINNNKDYNYKYDYINELYFDNLLDKNAKSLTRNSIIPCDHDIYINDNPSVLTIPDNPNVNSDSKKGIRSIIKKEKGIYTPYTFLPKELEPYYDSDLAKNAIIQRIPFLPDSFENNNAPLYFPNGLKVIEVHLFPYLNKKVLDGDRRNTLGLISMQLIFLNGESSPKDEILSHLSKINSLICEEPLPITEVKKIFNSNWKKYIEGRLDINKVLIKRKFFWSPDSDIRGGEKISVSMKILWEPHRQEVKRKISDAMEDLFADGKKITIKKVAEYIDMSPQTIKQNYWKPFKSVAKEMNSML
ncbi:hypothetical protein E9993_17070 [Labilibacter sediminis]|nr:hypothetical protein E9993_17070 [Labilibacter sediminis]